MADTATTTAAAFVDIRKLSLNGMTPFLDGADIRDNSIRGAHALLLMLGMAFEDSQTLTQRLFEPGAEEAFVSTCNNQIKADALYGVCTLLALAQHGADLDEAERAVRMKAHK